MKATFRKQVSTINEAAQVFADRGYHVSTDFSANVGVCYLCIFFYQKDLNNPIWRKLRCFADEGDKIEFNEFEREDKRKFYTLTLKKSTS